VKARDVVGRRIVRVNQTRFYNRQYNEFVHVLDSIWLDDGTRLVLVAQEDDYEPYVVGLVAKGT
jgi:hypothetical protein